jgi:hypothetical protein
MSFHWNSSAIDDLLRDPMVQAVMRADRVDPQDLKTTLRAATDRALWSSAATGDALTPTFMIAGRASDRRNSCEGA